MRITVQDFTGVYSEQPFMQGLRKSAYQIAPVELQNVTSRFSAQVLWLDCTKIAGTDCYCDDEAVEEINKLIDESGTAARNEECETAARNEECETAAKNEGCETAARIHFSDNGNYHYMSKIWTDRITEPFDLVVFDHHPDMQPPRFGDILSCGGWVKKVLEENKFVQNVVIIGVADHLIEELKADETAEFEKHKDRVTFIPESEIREWQKSERTTSHLPPEGDHAHVSAKALSGQRSSNPYLLSSLVSRLSSNLYFSIDKDALAPSEAATNWDQGSLTFETMTAIISELARDRQILGVDICGERAQEFTPIENGAQTAQEADELNSKLNQKLVEFLRCEV